MRVGRDGGPSVEELARILHQAVSKVTSIH